MSTDLPDDGRLQELLALRAVEGLGAEEQSELDQFGMAFSGFDVDALDRVAAALILARMHIEPIPGSLRARIESDARSWLASRVDI